MEKKLKERNQKIIDAIVAKSERFCPDSLALIGIYGSFMTGDIHDKSDLDLLILINDDNGWQLGCTFIQDDLLVGHDIYCTNWESLQSDACYENPNISKLMDSKIVYCADERYKKRLDELREIVNKKIRAPFSKEDLDKATSYLKEAEHFYTEAMITECLSEVRVKSGYVIYCVENAIAMLNKKYFRYGVKRTYEELKLMEKKPENLCEMIEDILSAHSVQLVQNHLTVLMKEVINIFRQEEAKIAPQKSSVTGDALRGSYEEMYSNWRNKMYYAAAQGNRHLAFMSMNSLYNMMQDIGSEVDIDFYDVLAGYNPHDLWKTAKSYDAILNQYLKEYEKVSLSVNHYLDIDAFIKDYHK